MSTKPATPTTQATVRIPDDLRDELHIAGGVGSPLLVAYTDADGVVRPSYRGSTHVHSDTQLAAWIRNPSGSLPRFVGDGAEVQVIYRNPRTDSFVRIIGWARLDDDPAVRDRVYGESSIQEQMADPQRAGTAMVIDVLRLAGTHGGVPVLVEIGSTP